MLRRRAASTGLVHGATCEHRDDREHLGARSQLQDGEEVCQVVSEHVARHGDRVQALLGPLEGHSHGFDWRHDFNVETSWIELWQVGPDPLHKNDIMSASGIQPEDGFAWLVVPWEVVGAAAVDCQLHPIFDGSIFRLACTIDVSLLDRMPQENLVSAVDDDPDRSI